MPLSLSQIVLHWGKRDFNKAINQYLEKNIVRFDLNKVIRGNV
ncbi:hypothetical protein J500_2599 [Acinetobacter sp. 479375]|nr:hypothetical protein J500_2599 [Acinetobacter sp. 479375]